MTLSISQGNTASFLNPLVTESPQKTAEYQSRKASLYNLVSKVCLVSFLAIAAVVIAISCGAAAPLPPALLLILVISTIPLQIGFQSYMKLSIEYGKKAQAEQMKALELSNIQFWNRPEIEGFFKKHNLSLESLPVDLLRRIDPQEPLRALLPVIASYSYWQNKAYKHLNEYLAGRNNSVVDPHFRLQGRNIGWDRLEREALPAFLNAALTLQIIAQPTMQMKFENIGNFSKKTFDQRSFDWMIDGKDEYFVFNDPNRLPLTLNDLQTLLAVVDTNALRLKLFPEADISCPAHRP